MMQQAYLRRCRFGADGGSESAGEPYFMDGTIVEQTNADFYLESLLRQLPLNFEHGDELRRAALVAN